MRHRPVFLRAFIALVVCSLAALASASGAQFGAREALGSVHGDAIAVSAPQATIAAVPTYRKTPSPDLSSRFFLPARVFASPPQRPGAPAAFAHPGVRDRADLARTYDATGPPVIPNTVR